MYFKKISILLILMMLVSCVSYNTDAYEIKHKIITTNQGTRSEGEWGELYIDNNKVPYKFSKIVIRKIEYKYLERNFLWEKGGYWPERNELEVLYSTKNLKKDEYNTGWYKGNYNECLLNTPKDWIWISRDEDEEFSYWIAPNRLDRFCDFFELEPLNVNKEFLEVDLTPKNKVLNKK